MKLHQGNQRRALAVCFQHWKF